MSLASARQQRLQATIVQLSLNHNCVCACVFVRPYRLRAHVMHFEIFWSVVLVGMMCKMSKKMQDGRSKFQVILLEDNRSIVLCKDEAQKCHTAILERHRIPTYVQL